MLARLRIKWTISCLYIHTNNIEYLFKLHEVDAIVLLLMYID